MPLFISLAKRLQKCNANLSFCRLNDFRSQKMKLSRLMREKEEEVGRFCL